MNIKQIAAALNISQSDARRYKQLYDVVKEITSTFEYEWYLEDMHLCISYDHFSGFVKFPLPDKYLAPGCTFAAGHQYTTAYAMALYSLLNKTGPAMPRMYDNATIQAILAALDASYLLPMSWGMHNDKPGITPDGYTYLQFDVDGSLLFTGTVRIIAANGTFGFELYTHIGMIAHAEYGYTLADCIKHIDIKIEHGPDYKQYRRMVKDWYKNQV